MRTLKKTLLPLLTALALFISSTVCVLPAMAESDARIDIQSCYATDIDGKALKDIQANSPFNLVFWLVESSNDIKNAGVTQDKINVSFSADESGFTIDPSAIDINLLSNISSDVLSYKVIFKNVKWNGENNTFKFRVMYSGISNWADVSTNISECKVRPAVEVPDITIAEPIFRVSTQQPAGAIKAGDEGELDVFIRNMGTTDAERIAVEIVGSDEVIVIDGTGSQDIQEIRGRDQTTIKFKYRALSKITSYRQTFTVKLTYFFFSQYSETVGHSETEFSFQSEISTTEHTYPVLNAQLDIAETSITPNKEYTGIISVTNRGTSGLKGVFAEITSTDGIVVTSSTSTRYYETVEQTDEKKYAFKFRTMNTLSARENITITLKYTYSDGGTATEGTYDRTFTLFNGATSADPELSAPVAVISLDNKGKTVSAGNSYSYKIEILNKGGMAMENVRLNVTPSDALTLTNASGNAYFDKISAGKSASHKVSFTTGADIPSARQTLTAEVTYSYVGADGKRTENTETQVLSVDAEVSGAPRIRLSGTKLTETLKLNNTYNYTLTFTNLGSVPVRELLAGLAPTDGIILETGELYFDEIPAGGSVTADIVLKTDRSFNSVKQSITAEMSYSYGAKGSAVSASASASIVLIASSDNVSSGDGGNNAAPNIIVGSYDLGAEQIAAGETFDMSFDFFNTSSVTNIENLIMTITAAGDINIYGSGNTFYYPSLSAGAAVSERISLRALATASTGISTVSISFKYDYLDNGNRNSASCEQSIFIPVYQPDKMTFDVKVPTYEVYAGNDVYITMSWLNKGRSDISNVKAEIVGDVGALSTEKIIGTVAPGGNGTADFIITPYMSGDCSFNIVVTYEDATLTEVSREIPVNFMVSEMMWEDPGFDPGFDTMEPLPEDGEGGFPWWIVFVGGGVLVAAGAVVIIIVCVKRRKKKKAAETEPDWEDDFDDLKS